MFGNAPREFPLTTAIVLIPNFSMIALTSVVEPMRMANRVSGHPLYDWRLITVDGEPVTASCGIEFRPTATFDEASNLNTVMVCSGIEVYNFANKTLDSWLRRMDRKGADIGALCTGTQILARAGLLNDHRCTIHWENLAAFLEEFPEIEVSTELFEIDRNRFTCSGGTAALDMMLNVITRQHGYELAVQVADVFTHERIRDHHDHQRMSLPARLGVRHPKLLSVIALMEQNLEEPLSRTGLAREAGLSTRQLERLFRKYLNRSPARHYLELRLNKSRLLLLQTNMSVIDVALACGFVSASHFSKCYRDFFGRTPRKERGLPPLAEIEDTKKV
ncbi:GlxA family transcriptional regulator [Pelagibius sp. Alg239-R121]|uniref:GlxA family transcriptional regulator n=1 Tax=Pelagibius sp. Alg239-R121 TaxID=2993448 RepID=UPI0024A63A42|nr:GlxA family transcriptional regulator [Pelagibius sp. Alg239-R121]